MTTTKRFCSAPHVHARRFDNETVLLSLAEGKYFALDDVGSVIWEHLTAGKAPSEVIALLLAEYEVDESTARADLERLAEELLAAGLLKEQT